MSRLPGGRLLTTRSPILTVPPVDLLEPRKHAQRGGLAAAGRADEDHELAVVHVEVEVGDGKEAVAVGLGHVVEGDSGHGYSFTAPADAFMIRRWKMKNRIATGIVINTDAASFSG